VRGRRSGRWRTVPIVVVDYDGERYLIAYRGASDWALNLAATRTARLKTKAGVEGIRVEKVPGGERPQGRGNSGRALLLETPRLRPVTFVVPDGTKRKRKEPAVNAQQKIAVTGATGRVGCHLVELLESSGHEVVSISRSHGVDVITGDGWLVSREKRHGAAAAPAAPAWRHEHLAGGDRSPAPRGRQAGPDRSGRAWVRLLGDWVSGWGCLLDLRTVASAPARS
jgi:hypothetical protein